MSNNNAGYGGRRVGAGRKKGSLTRRTREIAEQAAASGDTPAEVMMSNMRYAMREANSVEIDYRAALDAAEPDQELIDTLRGRVFAFREIAQTAAKDAAPYFHPRLAAVAHAGGAGMTLEDALDQLEIDDDEPTDGETEGDIQKA